VSVYRRGKTYWYKFRFGNRLIRTSAKTHSKTVAKEAEKKHRRDLEVGYKRAKKLRLRQRENCGRALTPEEENRILYAASKAKSPHTRTVDPLTGFLGPWGTKVGTICRLNRKGSGLEPSNLNKWKAPQVTAYFASSTVQQNPQNAVLA
jgi:hypothetical protein